MASIHIGCGVVGAPWVGPSTVPDGLVLELLVHLGWARARYPMGWLLSCWCTLGGPEHGTRWFGCGIVGAPWAGPSTVPDGCVVEFFVHLGLARARYPMGWFLCTLGGPEHGTLYDLRFGFGAPWLGPGTRYHFSGISRITSICWCTFVGLQHGTRIDGVWGSLMDIVLAQ